MRKTTLFFNLSIIVLAAITIMSCKKDDDSGSAEAPVSSFTFKANDKTVTFTNTSANATSYEWNFDDDSEVSTEKSPEYTFVNYGDYDVRLTAIGEDEQVVSKQTISLQKEWPVVVIDGSFDDWTDISTIATSDSGGPILELKVNYNGTNLLEFYVKKTAAGVVNVLDIFIDADNDTNTGWVPSTSAIRSWYEGNGADWSLSVGVEEFVDGEDVIAPFNTLYKYNSVGDVGWPFDDEETVGMFFYDVIAEISSSSASSAWVDNQVEFSIETTNFPDLDAVKFNLFVIGELMWDHESSLPSRMSGRKPATFSFQE